MPYVIIKGAKGAKVIDLVALYYRILFLPVEDNSFYFPGLWNLISFGDQAFEKSEDPIYVLENNIPIDPQYYLENQISKVRLVYWSLKSSYVLVICLDYMLTVGLTLQPLLRIFEPILKNASKELLQGSHTRSISISTPSTGGIMKFAKKQLTCIGCKTLLRYVRIALLFAFSISSLLFIPPHLLHVMSIFLLAL